MGSRYRKHILTDLIGPDGQASISSKKAVLIGCGALGSNIANLLARAGVGELLIVDRDLVELENIHRQVMFTEADTGRPKAEVSAEKLREINSEIKIGYLVKDVRSSNIREIVSGADVIMDGTDNIPVRMLINDVAVKDGIPWIYGGVLGTGGMVMTITGDGPCLRCLISELPEQGEVPTCETAGILNTVPALAAAVQVSEAFKILAGREPVKGLIQFDVRQMDFSLHELSRDPECSCCAGRQFDYLEGKHEEMISVLCDDAVQIRIPGDKEADLDRIALRLEGVEGLKANPFRLEFMTGGKSVTIFRDGRVIIRGTGDVGTARSIYSKFLGL